MTNEKRAVVLGVFRDRRLAESAVADLKKAGWQDDHISLVGQADSGILSSLKQALTEGTTAHRDEAASLDDLALPGEQRQQYQHELEAGSFLLLVEPEGRPLEVRDLLHRYGAYHVFLPLEIGGERIVPVLKETVQLQKEIVAIGEIRIHKRIITEDRTFTIPVTREEVTIERIPYQQPAPPPGTQLVTPETSRNEFNQREQLAPPALHVPRDEDTTEALHDSGVLRILVHEEQVLIRKQPVVVEEIVLHKQAVEETMHIVEPVKHEEVSIEQVGHVPIYEPATNDHDPVSER
jgi:stress response protein YsnF